MAREHGRGWGDGASSAPVALAVAAAYAAIAIAVHHAGPFYVFDMYAFAAPATTSRLVLVAADGAVVDPRAVDALRCQAPPRLALGTDVDGCRGIWGIDARDDEVYRAVATRPLLGAGEPMRLVRRAFRLDGAAVRGFDCAAVACTVRR